MSRIMQRLARLFGCETPADHRAAVRDGDTEHALEQLHAASRLVRETRRRLERQDNPVSAMVRGSYRRRRNGHGAT